MQCIGMDENGWEWVGIGKLKFRIGNKELEFRK
jgi:hypothetical protein